MQSDALVENIIGPMKQIEGILGISLVTAGKALILLFLGWGLALLLRALVRRIVTRVERLLPASAAVEGRRTADLISRAVFWLVMVLAIMTATETLGLPVITAWLSGVASYVPRILVSVVIAVIGVVAGRLSRHAVERATRVTAPGQARRFGRVAQTTVVAASILVAVEQLGIQVSFLTTAAILVLAALLASAALAFGLGGRAVVANILAAHYARKLYEVGQRIRIDGIEGRITRFTDTAVILESPEGDVVIPAKEFADVRSVRLAQGQ